MIIKVEYFNYLKYFKFVYKLKDIPIIMYSIYLKDLREKTIRNSQPQKRNFQHIKTQNTYLKQYNSRL